MVNGSAAACATNIDLGNNMPTSNANVENVNGKFIPASTPFELTGAGNDPDANTLTYQWDQYDLGPRQDVNAGDNGASPLFRSWDPSSSMTRVFPRISDLLNNTTVVGETLPTTTRSMNFQFIVRDNVGGWMEDMITLNVVNAAGPFMVTSQNAGGSLSGNINVTWNVAGTDANGINCGLVDVFLSSDGTNFDIQLANDVLNNGTAAVTLPDLFIDFARIKVKCADNVFFDVNDSYFNVVPTSLPCNVVTEITANPIANGIYSSATELQASGTVSMNGDVVFTGTTSIVLKPNFTINDNSFFKGYIFPCTP